MTSPRLAMSFEPNVTPMLDVLLVMIVAFLSVVKSSPAMNVQVPEPCMGPCVGTTENIVLEVMPHEHFRINRREIAAANLSREIVAIYAGRPDKVLHIAGYPGVKYSTVFTAMDVARSAGVQVISAAPRESYLNAR